MNYCFVCNDRATGVFCDKHIPKYGDIVINYKRNIALFVGSIPFLEVIKYYRQGYTIVKWWLGTDLLTMNKFPKGKSVIKILLHRIKMKIISKYIRCHWFVSERLFREANFDFNDYMIVPHQAENVIKRNKPLFVGYYLPDGKYNDWVYGGDYIKKLISKFPATDNIIFIRNKGGNVAQLFLNTIDIYIRPSRHDGFPRLVLLCERNSIPYYWSEDGNVDEEKLYSFVYEYYRKNEEPNDIHK